MCIQLKQVKKYAILSSQHVDCFGICSVLLPFALLLTVSNKAHAQKYYNELPAPSDFVASNSVVYLELVVNGLPSQRVLPVTLRENQFLLAKSALESINIRPDALPDTDLIAINELPNVAVRYDANLLRLHLDVPSSWLPLQSFSSGDGERVPSMSSTGMLLNYEIYSTFPKNQSSVTSAWSELRIFGNFGVLSNTGVWTNGLNTAGKRYIRYDTKWLKTDEDRVLTWEVGDLVSRGVSWGNSVRIGGIQVSRDFSLRPDIVTYPLPRFSGESSVPTAVDLFVDGYRASTTNVNPGPFVLSNVPFINGAGEAQMVVTDALGRQVTTSLPFYVSSSLLQKGLYDFSVGIGSKRLDYGVRNFSYGKLLGTASFRYGLNNYLTTESHIGAASDLNLLGLGAVLRLDRFGILNLSHSASRHQGSMGHKSTIGYQYTTRGFSIGAQHNYTNSKFRDISSINSAFEMLKESKSSSLFASINYDDYGGFGAGYFDLKGHDDSRTRLVNLSWNRSLWKSASISVSANREISGRKGWSGAVHMMMTLDGNKGSLSGGVEHNAGSGNVQRINYSRSMPSDGGFGWNVGLSHGDRRSVYQQADLRWRNNYLELGGGIYGNKQDRTTWANASGALVMMDGSLFAANRIGDTFVVVDTNAQPDIPVRYENQLVGYTNARGRLFVPGGSSNYAGKYEIDPLLLPVEFSTPMVEQRIAVKRGMGYLLRFPVHQVASANIVLQDQKGGSLPVGSSVMVNSKASAFVGWDGLVYVDDGLRSRNHITATTPEGEQCNANFEFDLNAKGVPRIGPVVCVPISK